nr:SDR family NAD(P)-dependent oxidoreductase [Phycicoccus sp.]
MKKAPGSHIINTSSLFGLIAPPGQSAYCTGKFGLRGFSESIAGELEDDGIGVTTVHPGGINTRIATSGRRSERTSQGDAEAGLAIAAKALRMPPPAKAARIILDATRRRKPRVLVGADAKLLDVIPRLALSQMRRILRVGTPRKRR